MDDPDPDAFVCLAFIVAPRIGRCRLGSYRNLNYRRFVLELAAGLWLAP
jgi:hypothetical protein